MLDLIGIIASVLAGWAALIVMHVGSGWLARRAAGLACADADAVLDAFFIGWAATVAVLQIWNIFFRIGGGLFWVFFAIGLGGVIAGRTELSRVARDSWPAQNPRRRALAWAGFALLVLALACWATTPSPDYDYGLYHTQAVRWAIEYPVVPGIGNLYARISHNCSSFLYVALLEDSFMAGKSPHFATSVLIAVGFGRMFVAAGRYFGGARTWHDLYWICAFPVLCAFCQNAGSIAPDVSIAVLMMVIMAVAVRFALDGIDDAREREAQLVYVALLSSVGLSVKLSFGPFGFVLLLLLAALWWPERSPRRAGVAGLALLLSLIGPVPWSVRGAIMTGYPLYPSPLFPLPVDWRVPRASVINVQNWIRGWGRHPGESWVVGFMDWSWLPRFIRLLVEAFLGQPLAYAIAACTAVTVVLMALPMRSGAIARLRRGAVLAAVLLWPVLAYDVFWLIAAPTLRFNRAGFVLPSVLALVLAVYCARGVGALGTWLRRAALAFVGVRAGMELLSAGWILFAFESFQPSSWHREAAIMGDVPHETYVSRQGVSINYRSQDEHFTGVPLPVSPHYAFCRWLAYREPGNLAAGFKVTPFYEGMITGFHGSAWPLPGFDPGPPPFWGYFSISGLGSDEPIAGPDGKSRTVRRAQARETHVWFEARGGRHTLVARGPDGHALSRSSLASLRLNGRALDLNAAFDDKSGTFSVPLDTRNGENEIAIAYGEPAGVVLEALQIWPPRAHGDEWWWGLYAAAGE